MDCSPLGSSVHGLLQARILEWVAIPFSREYSWLRDWAQFSCVADRFFTIWATREVHHAVALSWGLGLGSSEVLFTHMSSTSGVGLSVLLCAQSLNRIWLVVAHQASLSMDFSRQEYWSGLSFPSPGDLSYPGIKPMSLAFPALAGGFFTTVPPGNTWVIANCASQTWKHTELKLESIQKPLDGFWSMPSLA